MPAQRCRRRVPRLQHSHTTPRPPILCRVVLAQLGPGGVGGDLPPTPDFVFLGNYLEQHPLTADGEAWLAGLTAVNPLLGRC